ncbi:InlB B-repeat-containing protein [Persicobacter diffluens]|uniref:GLUG domain-containing protein n=1 Tax=Persicobacter diffluens TaxID=981 RepID=A0AAN4W1R1_9BACT|nr:hypothetical protein PEDI_36730 [Persicobacter diffluens]
MKFNYYLFFLILLFWSGQSIAQIMPAVGDGSEGNPYQIENLDHLKWLSLGEVTPGWGPLLASEASDNRFSAHYILMADIDCNEWLDFQPIASSSQKFTGTFNGNGHNISNVTSTNEASNQGFFAAIDQDAVISRLGLVDINMMGSSSSGGLVGWMGGNALVDQCFVTGQFSGTGSSTGGLVGSFSNGTIINSFSTCDIIGPGSGLVGSSYGGNLINCYAAGAVESGSGLINAYGTNVENSYWDIETTGQTESTGVDESFGLTTAQFANADNLVGFDFDMVWGMEDGRPSFLWSIFDVVLTVRGEPAWALGPVQGFGGYDEGEEFSPWGGAPSVAALPGYVFSKYTATDDPTFESDSPFLQGTVSLDMPKDYVAHFEENWTFGGEGGSGTAEDPYLITSENQLQFISNVPDLRDKHFILMADLDFSKVHLYPVDQGYQGPGFVPIGNEETPFTGTFNGNKHKISGLYINRSAENNVGLFGITEGAVISQLAVEGAMVKGGMNTAILVGDAQKNTSITYCYTTGEAEGTNYVGGLVGALNGNLMNSYSGAMVSGSDYVAGAVANVVEGVIDEVIAFGTVSGDITGGVVAMNTGLVQDVYWDKETTAQTSSEGSAAENGLTTLEMGDANNLPKFDFDANWEVTTIAAIDDNPRPYLQWQLYDYFLTVMTDNWNAMASVTGVGGVADGASVSIEAVPQIGYAFNEWVVNGEVVTENPYTFTFTSDMDQMIQVSFVEDYAFAGGTGTDSDPYQIETLEQLAYLSYIEGLGNHYYILNNDIDASATMGWHDGQGFQPIMNFDGGIDGQGYSIEGLYINRPTQNFVGLVANSTEFGMPYFKNIDFKNVNIEGADYVGAIAGSVGDANVSSVIVSGKVRGTNYVGGIVGAIMGGTGRIYQSSATGELYAETYAGGLVGACAGDIEESYANVRIIGGYSVIGGIVGDYNTSMGSLMNCFSAGAIEGSTEMEVSNVGGVMGRAPGMGMFTIANIYATGAISGTLPANVDHKGLVGNELGVVAINSYWDVQTTGAPALNEDIRGINTADFAVASNFDGWDFDNIWEIKIINEIDNNPRPYLRAFATHEITVEAGANGMITPGTTMVSNGNDATFSIYPNRDYKIASLTIDGTAVEVAETYTFENVTAPHTIAATFEKITFMLSVMKEGEGSLTIDGQDAASEMEVEIKSTHTFEFAAAAGYRLGMVTFNEEEIPESQLNITGGVYSWTTPQIMEASSFKVVFDRLLSSEVEVAPVVYPNPTKGQLNITSLTQGAKVKILNAAGQLVFSTIATAEEMKLSLAHYPNGLYHVVVEGKGSFKIIKD